MEYIVWPVVCGIKEDTNVWSKSCGRWYVASRKCTILRLAIYYLLTTYIISYELPYRPTTGYAQSWARIVPHKKW